MTDFLSLAVADNYRLARSHRLIDLDDDTYNIIRIPKFAFVKEIWLYVATAYAGGATGTATIGFVGNGESADPDGFMDSAACGAEATGMKRMSDDTQPGSQGKWFSTAGGLLTITLSHGTHTTLLTATVFMEFSILH
jgi:hypothetical protein